MECLDPQEPVDVPRDAEVNEREKITETNQQDSPLLRLPAEIRNTIYEYAISGETVSYSEDTKLHGSKGTSAFALIQTCRQIRHEARSVFYSLVPFDFGDAVFYSNTLVTLEAETMQAVQSIKVPHKTVRYINVLLSTGTPVPFLWLNGKHLARLSGLKHIHVDVPISEGLALEQFEYFVGYLKGTGKGIQLHVHRT